MVFLKALFLVHFSSLSILLLLVLLYLNLLSIIISMLMTLNSTYHSHLLNLRLTCFYFMMLSLKSQIECLLIGLPQQLSKLSNPILAMPSNVSITPTSTARNLGVIFDSTLSMSDHISAISKSCFCHIRDLRRIRSTLDLTTAKTIATSLIHSRLDYCNSLFLNLPSTELNRLQLVLHAAARAITKTSKFLHITPILKSLHWLKINQRIHYKILSLTYKTLQSNQPNYLYSLLAVQTNNITRSSSVLTLCRPTVTSRLKITNRSFFHHTPVLWNNLPVEMRQTFSSTHSNTMPTSIFPCLALSSSQFHSRLKTYLFLHSYPP